MASLRLSDYNYLLPERNIAMHPLQERDKARMLVYKADGSTTHSIFAHIGEYLPANTLLVLNDTRVVHARLLFERATGARIEVFCLHPLAPHTDISLAMQATGAATWECMAGNQKRWKTGEALVMRLDNGTELKATLKEKKGREVVVDFEWNPGRLSFSAVLQEAGKMPLPPYIHREADEQDEEDYQTVYASHSGAVAAPTAGLHFTRELLESLEDKGVALAHVTLHVGAGTFQPVEHEDVLAHPMHNEQVVFQKELIEKLATGDSYVVAAGTTSMRALESLYWFGNELQTNPGAEKFFVSKLQPYGRTNPVPVAEAMQNVLQWMETRGTTALSGETEIFIFPSYAFRICRGLITNFHLPQSTLLMLVSAFIGDEWKQLYQEALHQDYRFLSFGDGMLLLR